MILVYTLGSGLGWRNGRKMDYDVIYFSQRGVFANGDIHWVDIKGTIGAFDLVDEEFRELTSPPSKPRSIPGLHVLGDFLCASYEHHERFDLWVLKKNELILMSDQSPLQGVVGFYAAIIAIKMSIDTLQKLHLQDYL
ncbi:uncharacterized protein LOC113296299 isoform X1 [Papaver somniferum]|uniref:uncharacterized protein LOC113296299 isoform X1 n=1 Tax=Papaver somniferum TaxID=3469 RepID=UPI000E70352D|nr:uncharacterized protein LOC113296299 isoform X1 [Papaver somniferum]